MSVWKILKIPSCKSVNVGHESILEYQLLLRQFLYLFQNKINSLNSCLELLFVHEDTDIVDIYFWLHGLSNDGIEQVLEKQFHTFNYQCVQSDDHTGKRLENTIKNCLWQDVYSVLKTEKIVTTPYTYEGYYYWADVFRYPDKCVYDNFNMLFQTLLNSPYSYVSFQLLPTVLQEHEIEIMKNLCMFIEPHLHMMPNSYTQMYEPYALQPFQTYKSFVDSIGEPYFLFNIMAGSCSGNASSLANQIIAMLKSETENSIDLQSVKVETESLCTSEYEQFPYAYNELLKSQYRDLVIWGGNIVPPNNLFRLPFLITVDEALGFFHLPVDDGKIVGIDSSSHENSNELLNLHVTDKKNIIFGSVIGSNVVIGASPNDLTKHALIVGMPGTGKTTFSINMLMQFYKKGIPFLAIEPTKTEYRAMIDAIPELQIFTPGNNEVSPFVLNPFLPPKGIRIEKFIPSLFSAFKAAFSMPSPLDSLFQKAIQEAYTQYGWRDYSMLGDQGVTVFGLHEFIIVFKKLIKESNYGKEVKGNLESGGILRLSNLIEQNRNIFDTVNSIPVEDMLSKPTIIELNAIENTEQKALVMALVLINICSYIKNNQLGDGKVKNAILIDEAHVLLNQRSRNTENGADMQNSSIQSVENMIAEVRSYGTSVIIADQRPTAVGEAIVANTDVKIVFRLTENKERTIISDSTCMTENMKQQLAQLESGQAYVYYNKLKSPQLVQTPDIREQMGIRLSVLDQEIKEKNIYWLYNKLLLNPYIECRNCKMADGYCNSRLRSDANYFTNLVWNAKGSEIVDERKLLLITNGIPILLDSYLKMFSEKERDALIICIRIMLLRKAELEKSIVIKNKQKIELLSSAEVRKG